MDHRLTAHALKGETVYYRLGTLLKLINQSKVHEIYKFRKKLIAKKKLVSSLKLTYITSYKGRAILTKLKFG